MFSINMGDYFYPHIKFGGFDKSAINGNLVVLESVDNSSYAMNASNLTVKGASVNTGINTCEINLNSPYTFVP